MSALQPCRLAPAQSVDDDPNVFGFVIFLPSGVAKQCATRLAADEYLSPNAAKDFVINIVDRLLPLGLQGEADVRDVNWVSVIAAVQRLIIDWNRAKRDRLGAATVVEQGVLSV